MGEGKINEVKITIFGLKQIISKFRQCKLKCLLKSELLIVPMSEINTEYYILYLTFINKTIIADAKALNR
jgi:hypothetical protein